MGDKAKDSKDTKTVAGTTATTTGGVGNNNSSGGLMNDTDKTLYEKACLELQNINYYHGLLPREDINNLLKKPGEYLIRTTEPKSGEPRQIVLSYVASDENKVKHFIIQFANGCFHVDNQQSPSLTSLIQILHKKPIKGKTLLKIPVKRSPWELCHCDIEGWFF